MSAADLLDRILGRLEQVRSQCPDLRFGQLIATIAMLAEDETGHSLWDVEDADFAAAIERFAADLARRESDLTESVVAPDQGGLTPSLGSTAAKPPAPMS